MVVPYLVFLSFLAVERLVELVISRRHEIWAHQRGGREFGQRHFRYMKLIHSLFLPACAAEVVLIGRPFLPVLGVPLFVLALAAQALRYWAVFSLGSYWNVKVIVLPGALPVAGGPYRYIRHPNYLAVIVEGFAVPLIHSAWWTASGFSVLNAVLLSIRIPCEERALQAHGAYRERLGGRPRLLPVRLRADRPEFRDS